MLISKMPLFCLYDLSFYQYVHIVTFEGPCLKAHISVTDCSIVNLKMYSEKANQSLLSLYNKFLICPILTKLKLKVQLKFYRLY